MNVMIDGPMISRFIDDSEGFSRCADERFDLIEQNRNQKAKLSGESMALDREGCDDRDINRSEAADIDREKFREELMAGMAAAAEMIGPAPVQVVVDEASLMMKVYEGEVKRIEKEREEKMKKKKTEMVNGNHHEEEEEERENREIGSPNKMKKRRSMKFLSFCACSGKYYGDAENS